MTKHRCSFYLRWPEKPLSPVYAYVTFNSERFRFSIGLSVHTAFWDTESQKVHSTLQRKSYPQASSANAYLEQVRGEIGKVLSALVLQGTRPTPQLLAKHLESFRQPTKGKKTMKDGSTFFEAFGQFQEERKKHVGERRIAVFKTLENHLKNFEKEATVQKWRAITSHTGRKTFCTLSLLRGAMPDLVMKVSGHTDHRSFKRYIEITDKKTAEEMHRIWGDEQ